MNELYSRMGGTNGNFVRHFQGKGFSLAPVRALLLCVSESAKLKIDRSFERPDFLASRAGVSVAIECVTANPSLDHGLDIALDQMPQLSQSEIDEKVDLEPKRMTAILRKKLAQRYHLEAHVSGKPLILMIAPNFEAGAPSIWTTPFSIVCMNRQSQSPSARTASLARGGRDHQRRPLLQRLHVSRFFGWRRG